MADARARTVLAEIWTEVLQTSPINDGDDFFDLGGDSLAMVWLLAMIDERLGLDLSVEQVFADSFTFEASVRAVAELLPGVPADDQYVSASSPPSGTATGTS